MTPTAAETMVFLPAVDPDPVLPGLRSGFETHLAASLPKPRDAADVVVAAMREAALSPGKRIRPLLMLAATHALGRPTSSVMDAACALELIHAASLVMDDLPCMDDASLRRGRPTLHRQFGEDVASLAVIGLLSHAFRLAAASPELEGATRARLTVLLADAVGCQGLVGGQLRDLRSTEATRTARDAAMVNRCKTGALFRAALEGAAIAANAHAGVQDALGRCADEIGQAFQLLDDLKDDGALEPTGKDTHQDEGKATLLALLGRDTAQRRLVRHLQRVEELLNSLFPHEDVVLRLLRRGCGFDALEGRGLVRAAAPVTRPSAAGAA